MVVDVRKVLEAMRAKTQAIAAKVKAKPAIKEPIVVSFRISVPAFPQREPMRIPELAARFCRKPDKRGGQMPRYKNTRQGRGRCTAHISY